MSLRYKGAVISATPPTTTGGESGVASGSWTLEQQLQAQGAGNWPTPPQPNYIEDVFSTYLYTGNGSTQTITNGIDLSTKGGLVWTKRRDAAASNGLYDTARGAYNYLTSNGTGAQSNFSPGGLTAFNSNGFSIADDIYGSYAINGPSGATFTSWTFRKQPKFFDVVTWTGNSSYPRDISHNLGSAPGCIIAKRTDSTGSWMVYHVSTGIGQFLELQTTGAAITASGVWSATPTSTQFTVGSSSGLNFNGATYVAYLFAHDAGGFGLTGTDNVISCGSFTTNGSGAATISLGYEPQWVMTKRTDSTGPWGLYDTMRGWSLTAQNYLLANDSGAEGVINATGFAPNATGFTTSSPFDASATYIYIAIRRGPMKVPTSGTSVFSPVARTGTGTSTAVTTPNFPPDMLLQARRGAPDWPMSDRLRGVGQNLAPCYTSAESTPSPAYVESYDMTGATLGSGNAVNGSGLTYIEYFFRRAPSFFDEVCYTGNGGSKTVAHNLGVAPELIIIKGRDQTASWWTYSATLGYTQSLRVNVSDAASSGETRFGSSNPTSSNFYVDANSAGGTNSNGYNYVAYLFATCAGVSKVGSYTGNGSTQTIDCGFTGGARFVLIKRTDSTGDWYVYDTARGMTVLTDPYLLLNSTAAESATLGSVTTVSTGFAVNASILAAINTNGASYIFLAIA